ncbi:P68 family surface lipoprotein [[Mycoplasma] gypis]|uniref:P68 family surface lipoprotein n=1 Tax=[Mycoplasma] gypis TaxID=92404 RepID=UPI0019672409|nr:P80 family lipoprotein [[Mycoplasma] gypis]MBN0919030.1 P80 family lipoprotein [[Mycoplasma] gypis]
MKKVTKFLAATAVLVAPVAGLAASCQAGRFDQNDDGKLLILSPWSDSNRQGQILREVVDYYNKHQTNAEDFLPVNIEIAGKGYQDTTLQAKLNARDKGTLANVVIQYPTVASTILSYDMQLPFDDLKDTINSIFSETFLDVNSTISGNKDNHLLTIPMTKSGEMLTIDKILVGKFATELVALGATLDPNATLMKSYVDYYKKPHTTGESGEVDKIWESGKIKDSEVEYKNELKSELANYTISDSIFTSYEELIKFSKYAKKMYPYSTYYVLGLDSFPNQTFVAADSLVGSTNDALVNKDASEVVDGGYNFKSFHTSGTPQNKTLKAVYELFKPGFEANAIWVGGGGAYGSSSLTVQKMAFSLGSTAGYSHTFYKDNAVVKKFHFATNIPELSAKKNVFDKITSISNVGSKLAPTDAQKQWAILEGEQYKNPILKSTEKKVGKHDYILSDKNADAKFAEIQNQEGFLVYGTPFVYDESKKVVKYKFDDDADFEFNKEVKYLGQMKQGPSGKLYDLFFLPQKYLIKSVSSGSGVVNELDADWIAAPSKVKSTDTTNYFLTQGPSIMGVHANDKEDKATKAFIKWLISERITLTVDKKTYENSTPVEIIAAYGSYIAPTKNILSLDKNSEAYKKLKLNKATEITFDALKDVLTNPNSNKLVEDPAAPKSQTLRQGLEAAGKSFMTTTDQGKEMSFNQFVLKIKQAVR